MNDSSPQLIVTVLHIFYAMPVIQSQRINCILRQIFLSCYFITLTLVTVLLKSAPLSNTVPKIKILVQMYLLYSFIFL